MCSVVLGGVLGCIKRGREGMLGWGRRKRKGGGCGCGCVCVCVCGSRRWNGETKVRECVRMCVCIHVRVGVLRCVRAYCH